MSELQVASRYARALFALAKEEKVLDPVHSDLNDLAQWLSETPDAAGLFTHPDIPASRRNSVLTELFDGKVHDLTLRFLRLLNAKQRLGLTQAVIRAFDIEFNRERKLAKAHVTTAKKIRASELKQLQSKLSARIDGTVEIDQETDESLIGGFRARVGNRIYDAAVSTQLERLKDKIINA